MAPGAAVRSGKNLLLRDSVGGRLAPGGPSRATPPLAMLSNHITKNLPSASGRVEQMPLDARPSADVPLGDGRVPQKITTRECLLIRCNTASADRAAVLFGLDVDAPTGGRVPQRSRKSDRLVVHRLSRMRSHSGNPSPSSEPPECDWAADPTKGAPMGQRRRRRAGSSRDPECVPGRGRPIP